MKQLLIGIALSLPVAAVAEDVGTIVATLKRPASRVSVSGREKLRAADGSAGIRRSDEKNGARQPTRWNKLPSTVRSGRTCFKL
jgi:hypothetical protein